MFILYIFLNIKPIFIEINNKNLNKFMENKVSEFFKQVERGENYF